MRYADLSLWLEQAGDLTPRPALPGPLDADVAIVGAGFTGLWTAYYLAAADPALRIVVLEREIAGFGASGRNGGWCYGHLNGSLAALARESTRDAAVALRRAGYATVDEIGRVLAAERIDAGFVKGGALTVARTPGQAEGLREHLAREREWGFGADVVRWQDAGEVTARVAVAGAVAGLYEAHCARVQPARLARGLAAAVERRGVAIFERTPVLGIAGGVVRTPYGDVRAELVVRATEGYTVSIPGQDRRVQPITSQIVATEPLDAAAWEALGWSGREAVADCARLGMYAQRTVDDRIALGGRGGFRPRAGGADEAAIRDPRVFGALRRAVRELFPAAGGAAITHEWGGVWGAARDWCPSVGFSRERRFAWAGGYGDGVAASNLAGRTLADLIVRRESELTALPWINRRAPAWPPDPLPRLGARLVAGALGAADAIERRRGRAPRWVAAVERVSRLGEK